MKKLLITAFIIFLASVNTYTQFTSPESVTYDSLYNRWLVTNSSGVIKQISSTGTVTDFAPGGSGSHGIRIYNGVAYACAGTVINGFSLATGAQVFTAVISGSSFLNGMGIDNATGIAYISDFSAKKIYKLNLNTNTWWVYVTGIPETPNGVYVDKPRNRLLVCCWGTNAAVKSVSLADSSATTILNTGYNNLDGIYLDRYDNVYISSWSPSPAKIIRYNINFTGGATVVVNSGLGSPADIFIKKSADTLAVPNSSLNSVTFHNISITGITPLYNEIPQGFSLEQNYPNPFNPSTNFEFKIAETGLVKLSVYDALGREIETILNKTLTAGTYKAEWNASNYPSGVYFYRITAGEFSEVRKMTLVK